MALTESPYPGKGKPIGRAWALEDLTYDEFACLLYRHYCFHHLRARLKGIAASVLLVCFVALSFTASDPFCRSDDPRDVCLLGARNPGLRTLAGVLILVLVVMAIRAAVWSGKWVHQRHLVDRFLDRPWNVYRVAMGTPEIQRERNGRAYARRNEDSRNPPHLHPPPLDTGWPLESESVPSVGNPMLDSLNREIDSYEDSARWHFDEYVRPYDSDAQWDSHYEKPGLPPGSWTHPSQRRWWQKVR